MGLIKTVCNGKEEPIEVSLTHNFPTGKNGRKTFSSQFNCPYASKGGGITCYYPYEISSSQIRPAWLVQTEKELPEEFKAIACPVFTNLVFNYTPYLSLPEREERKIPPNLIGKNYEDLTPKQREEIEKLT